MAGGRPSTYTPEIGEQLCEMVANAVPWREIFRVEGMPAGMSAVLNWERRYPEFATQLAQARMACAEMLADGLDVIVDENPDPARARIKVDSAKWKASKLSPRWADKVQVDIDHKVSISAALDLAKQRALGPVWDQHDTLDLEPVAQSITYEARATDYVSDAEPEPVDLAFLDV